MIHVRKLQKYYRVHQRAPGLTQALKSLFRRQYTQVKAVDGIDFDIQPGERVGFLGPNGAGKTTTLKMLSGLLYPTAGEVQVDGHTPHKREVALLQKIMLVMGQKQQLLWDLPPADTFELNRAIYNVPSAEYLKRMDELITLLELGGLIQKPTRQLSLGERMKCELAAALVHGPKVLFLDEPTIGLDVSMQGVMRDFIRSYNEKHGATLILTSHYMDDVAALCPRVILIDRGQLSFDGSLEALIQKVRPEKRITLRLCQAVSPENVATIGTVVKHEAAEVIIQVPQDALHAAVSRALQLLPVQDFNVESPPLEEVMSELFTRAASKAQL